MRLRRKGRENNKWQSLNAGLVKDASRHRSRTARTADSATMAEPNPGEAGEVKTLWVGDLVRASSSPAPYSPPPPIFYTN